MDVFRSVASRSQFWSHTQRIKSVLRERVAQEEAKGEEASYFWSHKVV